MKDFENIIELIDSGLTVEQSCLSLGISRRNFYRTLTANQKVMLKEAFISRKKKVVPYGIIKGNIGNNFLNGFEEF